ncbi:SpoIIE family protein phosphatase [Streptomyces sp. LP05-1]|uniref:SpoIIE family protein phosphatase n=1 Tax=Streptomyces pyxinae TaxID=2970734 RepID=A0ABT2CLY1_9ACTN|nr:SpoIIE family protein phosphatase [Streptomyces sp. LP05-1]MCS0638440.1 SpoIIE family protein phosphatase [Streptomyces sp. LP05-1]
MAAALADATVGAIEAVGGYGGGVYLRSGTPGLLRLAVLAGLPGPLMRPWWRMHINRPFPIAEAYRTGRPVYLADAEDAMRRFPQLMAGLPFPFGSLYAPVGDAGDRYGVLVALRPATPGRPVAAADRERMLTAAGRLGAALAATAAGGGSVTWDGEPVCLQLPTAATPPVRTARFTWDPDTGAVHADEELPRLLGLAPGPPLATAGELLAALPPEDAYGLWALAHRVAAADRTVRRRIWLRGREGRPYLLELDRDRDGTGDDGRDVPGAGDRDGTGAGAGGDRRDVTGAGGRGRTLTGFLVDPGSGPVVAAAGDRLPRGLVSLDRLGRISHVSSTAETLLGHSRTELTGRVLWEAVEWFGRPAYEDHLRAALLSDEPVDFLAHRDSGHWLAVSVHPGHDGLTLTLADTDRPAYSPGAVSGAGPGIGSPADRAGVLYRPVALAIALTEAVTARQVSAVVTDELLPAFGGRQLAIYLLDERQLHLAWETGFPQGFLDRFDGVGLDARLPGVETLTTGRPLFFESMGKLADAYPGIPMDAHVGARAFLPLIASGRRVGSCILGFDQPRGFSPEERTVLTALAGLIAQALDRARRYDSEAALARGLQDALLPHRLPRTRNLDTAARYLPGTQGMEVGGDWYDVVVTGRGLALVVGDVQGHGVAAAATMGQLRSALRAFALQGHDPREVVSGTNRLLIDLDPGQFASCVYAVTDPATGLTRAIRAGHPQPLLRHPDGRTEVLDLPGGVVLGVDPAAAYPVTEFHLPRGATLALYTDGLVERPGTDIDQGVERLRAALAGVGRAPLAEVADRLIGDARQATDRPDDIALLLAARTGPEEP